MLCIALVAVQEVDEVDGQPVQCRERKRFMIVSNVMELNRTFDLPL